MPNLNIQHTCRENNRMSIYNLYVCVYEFNSMCHTRNCGSLIERSPQYIVAHTTKLGVVFDSFIIFVFEC